MGVIIKWLFILFNLLMAFLTWQGMVSVGEVIDGAASEAERAGAAIGAGIGITGVLFFWVLGDVILGLLVLFTRPKK